jgi:hypothetical protein
MPPLSRILIPQRHIVQSSYNRTRLAILSSQIRAQTMATSIPKCMKAVIIEKTGGVEVLDYRTEVPVPAPKAGEILVKNDFVGVNYIDTYVTFIQFGHREAPYLTLIQILPNWTVPGSQARNFGPRWRRHCRRCHSRRPGQPATFP